MQLASTFADAALGSQAVFRALLDALAHPGTVCEPRGALPAPPPPAHAALYAAALTLVDFETPVWLDAALAPIGESLRFHTGAPLVGDPARAAFALIGAPATMPPLTAFAQGTPEFPDRSATLLVQVAGFAPAPWRLTGPGIADERGFGVHGLPPEFAVGWRENHARFPQGVDLVLASGRRFAGLPRTTWIEG